MDEYIRKQDALDAFGLSEKTRKYGGDHSGYDTRMLYEIQDTIESLEPADVVPVVHAHWYILEYESLTCSRCNGFYYTGCDSTAEAEKRLKEGIYPKYCPHCGAKMDGDE